MSLIGTSDTKSSVNLSLPENVVERLHYQAKHHSKKRAIVNGDIPVSVSVGYEGSELTGDQVKLVESYISWIFYSEVPSKYFD